MKNLRWLTWHLLLAFTLFLAVQAGAQSGRDIFTNEGQTRRPAQGAEFEIALGLGGCAGSLIAPNLGLSAAHCQKTGAFKSGVALRDGKSNDGSIVRTVEIGSVHTLDYWIFEIRWQAGQLPAGMRVVPKIQTAVSELTLGNNGDAIFTLGFPSDISHGKLIRSWGYGRQVDGASLVNNISLINGNSGGGIWRTSDEMLVSIVSGGPHAFGQPGWKGNDWNDSGHWNWGPAMYQAYGKSQTLKDVFPGGKNKYLSSDWELEEFNSIANGNDDDAVF